MNIRKQLNMLKESKSKEEHWLDAMTEEENKTLLEAYKLWVKLQQYGDDFTVTVSIDDKFYNEDKLSPTEMNQLIELLGKLSRPQHPEETDNRRIERDFYR